MANTNPANQNQDPAADASRSGPDVTAPDSPLEKTRELLEQGEKRAEELVEKLEKHQKKLQGGIEKTLEPPEDFNQGPHLPGLG
ncbi:MAG: hypothetical protein JO112_07455 [Planctomycetes bacterium]|nr:hypothetical protein [Planctomycetota bacterium]